METSSLTPTEAAALQARDALGKAALSGPAMERDAAAVARTAIFEEALLGAIHARLAELKAAAR